MEEQKYADVSGTFISPPGSISARIDTADPDPPVKPPRPKWFIDLHLKAAKFASIEVIRAGIREVIREVINSLPLGRKRQPAQA